MSHSIIELGDLIVEWTFNTALIISVKLFKPWQGLNPITISVQDGELFEKLALGNPLHHFAEFKHCEVYIGYMISDQELIGAHEPDERLHFH